MEGFFRRLVRASTLQSPLNESSQSPTLSSAPDSSTTTTTTSLSTSAPRDETAPRNIAWNEPNLSFRKGSLEEHDKQKSAMTPELKSISHDFFNSTPSTPPNTSSSSLRKSASSLPIFDSSLDEEKRAAQEKFQSLFKFPVHERLLETYTCTFWKTVVFVPGTMYVSDNHISFEELTGLASQVIIPFKEVLEISKADLGAFTPFPTSLKIQTAIENYWFSTFFNVEEVYNTLLKNWRLRDMVSGSIKPRTNKQRLKLPAEEFIIAEYDALFFRRERRFPGKIVISNHFFSFVETRRISPRKNRVVIPFAMIEVIQKEKMIPTDPSESIVIQLKGSTKLFAFDTKSLEAVYQLALQKIQESDKDTFRLPSWSISCWTEYFVEFTNGYEFSEEFKQRQTDAKANLEKYFNANGDFISMIHTKELTELCRCDIPYEFSAHVWNFCSGAMFKQFVKAGYYNSLLQQNAGKDSPSLREIEKDLPRTFPEHSFVQKPEGIDVMRRILTAYSWRNPNVGYCQSMNYVCTFLIFLLPEEQVFWLLCAICEDLMPKYYCHDMVEARTDQMALARLLEIHLPDLTKKFELLGTDPIIFVLPWFLCLFICHFPIEGLMIILHRFFNEGKKVLFQVTLAIFDVSQFQLLQPKVKRSDHMEQVLRNCRQKQWKQVLQVALEKYSKVTNLVVEKIRQPFKAEVVQEIIRHNRFQRIRDLMQSSKFDPFELEEIHEKFAHIIAPFSSTVINVKQFQDSCFPSLFSFWKQRSDICFLLFTLLDTKNDSLLDFSEYTIGLSILFRGPLKERLEFCLKMHDLNHDNRLDHSAVYCALDSFVRIFYKIGFGEGLDEFVEKILAKNKQTDKMSVQQLVDVIQISELIEHFKLRRVVDTELGLIIDLDEDNKQDKTPKMEIPKEENLSSNYPDVDLSSESLDSVSTDTSACDLTSPEITPSSTPDTTPQQIMRSPRHQHHDETFIARASSQKLSKPVQNSTSLPMMSTTYRSRVGTGESEALHSRVLQFNEMSLNHFNWRASFATLTRSEDKKKKKHDRGSDITSGRVFEESNNSQIQVATDKLEDKLSEQKGKILEKLTEQTENLLLNDQVQETASDITNQDKLQNKLDSILGGFEDLDLHINSASSLTAKEKRDEEKDKMDKIKEKISEIKDELKKKRNSNQGDVVEPRRSSKVEEFEKEMEVNDGDSKDIGETSSSQTNTLLVK